MGAIIVSLGLGFAVLMIGAVVYGAVMGLMGKRIGH